MTVSGIASFVLIFAALVFFHELGHFLFAKLFKMRVEEFALGIGPRLLRVWNDGQTDYTIRALPLGGFVRVAGMEIEDATERRLTGATASLGDGDAAPLPHAHVDPDGFNNRPIRQRFWVILAGPLFSFLLGWLALCLMGAVAGVPDKTAVGIAKVVEGGVADAAGLKAGETIVALNDRPVEQAMDALDTIRASQNKPIRLTVKDAAGGATRTLTVTPRPETVDTAAGGKQTIGRIGIEPRPVILTTKRLDLAASFAEGNKFTAQWFITMASLFKSGEIKNSIGGPVAIFKETQQAADQGGPIPLLLLGQLSLSLGLFNLFPIPILDGGHLTLMALEAVRRRKLSAEQTQRVFMAGFAVLALLFVVVLAKDLGIFRLFARG